MGKKVEKVKKVVEVGVPMRDVIEADVVIARYVVRPQPMGRLREDATAEQRAAYAEEVARSAAKSAVVDRVARFVKFSTGLGRNVNLLRSETKLFNEALQTDRAKAYQKALNELLATKAPDGVAEEKHRAAQNDRMAELAREHDVPGINEEINARREELLADASGIVAWYRMPLSYLPGWGDADGAAEEDRRGVVDPLDIAALLRLGILYDPEDAADDKAE